MLNREVAYFSLIIVSVGVFIFARNLNSEPAAIPPAAPQPVAAEGVPTVAPTPAQPIAEQKVTAEAKPKLEAAPKPVPVAPKAAKVAKAVPPPVQPVSAPPKAIAAPAPSANPDDATKRTQSGKVKASTNPKLPPAYGPVVSKVHVIVYSDFQ